MGQLYTHWQGANTDYEHLVTNAVGLLDIYDEHSVVEYLAAVEHDLRTDVIEKARCGAQLRRWGECLL